MPLGYFSGHQQFYQGVFPSRLSRAHHKQRVYMRHQDINQIFKMPPVEGNRMKTEMDSKGASSLRQTQVQCQITPQSSLVLCGRGRMYFCKKAFWNKRASLRADLSQFQQSSHVTSISDFKYNILS